MSTPVLVKVEDFRESGYAEVIESVQQTDYPALWSALSGATQGAAEQGQDLKARALSLLAQVCSMRLRPKSPNDPFLPLMSYGANRSALPEDFSSHQVGMMGEFAKEVDHPLLRARLADLAWLKLRPRSIEYAFLAIDAYSSCPPTFESWLRGLRDCWDRAISLAKSLGPSANDRLRVLQTALLQAFDQSAEADKHFPVLISDLLASHRLAGDEGERIARRLEELATATTTDPDLRQRFLKASSDWFAATGDEERAADLTCLRAEAATALADQFLKTTPPSYMLAHVQFERALGIYRSISRTHRLRLKVEEAIDSVEAELRSASSHALDQMKHIELQSVDLTGVATSAREAVQGRSTIDALRAFVCITRGAKVSQLRDNAKEQIAQFPLVNLFPHTHFGADGRVVAKQPGVNVGANASEESNTTLWSGMVRLYCYQVEIASVGRIGPAHSALLLEHRLNEGDFVALATHAGVVPHERERLWGAGLYAGYEMDFAAAIHLLIPQLEHLIRFHLNARGNTTVAIDQDGIMNEKGMSSLVDHPGVGEIFGPDLAFELKAMFCDGHGPNLRNQVAHGLLADQECRSVYCSYAWWLCLKMVLLPLFNARRASPDPVQRTGSNSSSASPHTDSPAGHGDSKN